MRRSAAADITDPDLRQAVEFLSVHAARMAAHGRLAADAGDHLPASWPCCFCWSAAERARWADGSAARLRCPGAGFPLRSDFCCWCWRLRIYIGRFELLFEHHTIFDGVSYTDAHVTITGLLFVCAALVIGAAIAIAAAAFNPRGRWLAARSLRRQSVIWRWAWPAGT